MSEALAIAQLLADPDPTIVASLRQKLAAREGDPPGLREAIEALEDPTERARAREARLEVGRERAAEKLVRLASQAEPDLEAGAFEIAHLEQPDGADGEAIAALEQLGSEAREAIARIAPDSMGRERARIEELVALLGRRHGFAGDREDDDVPRLSSLGDVLARKRGLPIALAVVYLLVGKRAGVPLLGIGAPLHFLVGAPSPEGMLFVDAFDGGRILDLEGAAALLRSFGVVFRREHLAPVTTKQILARMARNLVAHHARRPRGESRARRAARVASALEGST